MREVFALLLCSIVFGVMVLMRTSWTYVLATELATILFTFVVDMDTYWISNLLFQSLIFVFFREVDTRNSHSIPAKGPVMFVCAPHASQFVDPILIMTCIPSRSIHFVMAAKSMRKKFVGLLGRLTHSIPVERPQDVAKPGSGTVTIQGTSVTGKGTAFTTEVKVGDSIACKGKATPILSIDSDTEITLKFPSKVTATDSAYKVQPKLDHTFMFKHVFDTFRAGECVGIFPEGGSHDQTYFLPFKAGAASMTLGAMAHGSKPVYIVPVGLNYFHGHRFRSRALLDFGYPIEVSPELVKMYEEGGDQRREANKQLLEVVTKGIESVTMTARDYDTLRIIWAVRRLYKPQAKRLTLEETQQLTKRFLDIYDDFKDHEKVRWLKREVDAYNTKLESYGIRDHQVAIVNQDPTTLYRRLATRLVMLFVEAILLMPFVVLGLPILYFCRKVADTKAKEAVAGSTVKDAGRDVKATWKLMTALVVVPVSLMLYSIVVGILFGARSGLATFALLPLPLLYLLRVWDHFHRLRKSLPPLVLALWNQDVGKDLLSTRKLLKAKIRELVDEVVPAEKRMFTAADFVGEDD
eukprot:m.31979 g.31979  ORF g.31979 m.31979 type:complete len:580 (-) comp9482_c0_seq2:1676-3415(-)